MGTLPIEKKDYINAMGGVGSATAVGALTGALAGIAGAGFGADARGRAVGAGVGALAGGALGYGAGRLSASIRGRLLYRSAAKSMKSIQDEMVADGTMADNFSLVAGIHKDDKAKNFIRMYFIEGGGKPLQNTTGPHGRGAGPGEGQADGSGYKIRTK